MYICMYQELLKNLANKADSGSECKGEHSICSLFKDYENVTFECSPQHSETSSNILKK